MVKIKKKKRLNFDDAAKENIKEHNPNWPKNPDHSCRILITEDSGYGKMNSLFNLINDQPDIDKKFLYAKDPREAKYHIFLSITENNVFFIMQLAK